MRVLVMIACGTLAWATSTALAQDPSVSPTRVNEEGVYACPNHPDILATWPARCPICQTVLSPVPTAATQMTQMPGRNRQGGEGNRGREQFRGEVQRRNQFRGYYRPYGYPPYAYGYRPYAYGYRPPLYFGPPPAGYFYYPNRGFYYNPGIGLYYYPSRGYFYSPYYRRYYSYRPGQGYFYFQIPIR